MFISLSLKLHDGANNSEIVCIFIYVYLFMYMCVCILCMYNSGTVCIQILYKHRVYNVSFLTQKTLTLFLPSLICLSTSLFPTILYS